VYRQVLEIGDEGPKIDKARLSLARVLVRREELNQAQELVTQVLTNNPRNAEALILDGRIALERDDPGTAIAQFQGVLRDAPREVEVLRLLARAQFESGKQLLALDGLNQAVDADPANVPARLELARLMAKTGDRAGAKAQYQAILERHPDQAVALEQMTKIQVGERDWGGAVKSAERAKAAYPDAGWPYLYTGMALIIRGAQQAGIRDLETAYSRSPEDSKVLLVLVRSLISTGQVDVAVSTLNESLVENHNNVVARILLAEVLSQQGKVKEAEKQFEIAIENDPASERPYLAFARHQLGRGDTEQSARTFERGLKATGGSANILIELGVAYERLGEPERAIRILEQALNEEPEAKAAANNLAVLLATYRQDSASLDRAKLLAESLGDTRNPSFADTLGWVYLRRGDVDAAIPLLERALSAFPDSPEVHYHLGAAFEAKGEIESSRAHLKRALATSASFPGIEDAKARLKALGDG
jgi:tetratricopeptide (TPR) repeat protein